MGKQITWMFRSRGFYASQARCRQHSGRAYLDAQRALQQRAPHLVSPLLQVHDRKVGEAVGYLGVLRPVQHIRVREMCAPGEPV